jgi:photosynthetic reaction center H subunit
MSTYGSLTGYIDVAQVTLYAFWFFFAGLIFYLRTEDKREGFPMESERVPGARVAGFPPIPSPKTFHLGHGQAVKAPHPEPLFEVNASATESWPGAPLTPNGDPMLAGVGPGAWVARADVPDHMYEDGAPKIVPLRAAPGFSLATEDPDPRGFTVIGGDEKAAGTITDVWVDRSEVIIRYYEIDVTQSGGVGRRLIPATLAQVKGRLKQVRVNSLLASQFAAIPKLKTSDQVTLREEDQVVGYFGGGQMYATASRLGPLI